MFWVLLLVVQYYPDESELLMCTALGYAPKHPMDGSYKVPPSPRIPIDITGEKLTNEHKIVYTFYSIMVPGCFQYTSTQREPAQGPAEQN